jgi:hypothetical protein
MCTTEIPDEHSHVVDLDNRGLMCACRGCYLLFSADGAGGKRFRAVPERYLTLRGFALSPGQWEELQIPVAMAFFFHNSREDRVVAFYPSPAGATESLLPLETWEELMRSNPILSGLEPDVEALLVYKRREHGEAAEGAKFECYVVPIDACYELVGRIRKRWKGFEGGEEAWSEIDAFFASVREKSGEPAEADPWPI